MRAPLPALALALLLVFASPPTVEAKEAPPPRTADVVLCLDASGSMQALIETAKARMAQIVTQMSKLRPRPILRLALITYGQPGSDATGHVVLRSDLTTDHDAVLSPLFEVQTSGGTELVGRVIETALDRLAWSDDAGIKSIFIAGNESADQDRQAPSRAMATRAKARGIAVHALYCGRDDDGDAGSWRALAEAGGGRFVSIDPQGGSVTVQTPFDAKLGLLSKALSNTYMHFGRGGAAAAERQRTQDSRLAEMGAPAAADRAVAKASGAYGGGLDLVAEVEAGRIDLATLEADALPEALRDLTPEQRAAKIKAQSTERARLQSEIQALAAKRQAHIVAAMKAEGLDDSRAMDKALREALTEQAKRLGYEIDPR